ncbi:glucose-6-phosphate 1-dehydrogenase [Schizosaccharomyces japonicus yFS275]|uniref:Glucose-6-phosphate 1-dehydrogenase n=1 Tax=Schizosaccharomyces japonicus (strain yFS275 / FY16936) TaxID=402676 RepID=B6K1N7_SCHJY|nr:glucose-6-phosphate 1-dehydrogenase [Schizosaccharomyces japonicus yFS275]EEB07068.1 glucose-6-phosphate 1-dehydrogenase [Schizosaccharomyces japonicus yFS275]
MLTIIVFGGSGHVAKTMIYPALFLLYARQLLPSNSKIIGFARSDLSREDFEMRVVSRVSKESFPFYTNDTITAFVEHCVYFRGSYTDENSFVKLNDYIKGFEAENLSSRAKRIFYLGIPPSLIKSVSMALAKLDQNLNGDNRLIIEKPVGDSLESARDLLEHIRSVWPIENTYKVDHYLGMEMFDALLMMRFANPLFANVWTSEFVESIHVTLREQASCEGRSGYYDSSGVLRDNVQNHLLQLLCSVAMDEPKSLEQSDVAAAKIAFLRSIRPLEEKDLLLGQYIKSKDRQTVGYRELEGVAKDSNTPTFAVCQLHVDNDRWKGVPIVISSGKGLKDSFCEVRIVFKNRENGLFRNKPNMYNRFIAQIFPRMIASFELNVKEPGFTFMMTKVASTMDYQQSFSRGNMPLPYERVLWDVINSSHSHFVTDEEILLEWQIVDKVLDLPNKKPPLPYQFGSDCGPRAVEDFMKERNMSWD